MGRPITSYLTGAEGQGLVEMLDRVHAGERVTARGVRFGVVTPAGSAREVFADMDFLPLRDAPGAVVGTPSPPGTTSPGCGVGRVRGSGARTGT